MFGLDLEVNANLLLIHLLKIRVFFGVALNNVSEVDLKIGVIAGVRVQSESLSDRKEENDW